MNKIVKTLKKVFWAFIFKPIRRAIYFLFRSRAERLSLYEKLNRLEAEATEIEMALIRLTTKQPVDRFKQVELTTRLYNVKHVMALIKSKGNL